MELIANDDGSTNCPWNHNATSNLHTCGVRYTSICKYFCGIKYMDGVLCSYPHENITVLNSDEIDRPLRICPSCGRQHGAHYTSCPFCKYVY